MRARKLKKTQKSSKNFEKSLKNLLTSSRKCDIINKLSERKSLLENSTRKFKNFEKSLKNLLTNSKRCDIITKSPERNRRDEVRKLLEN